jgi:hypothetical protein
LHLVLLELFITMTPAAWYVARAWYIDQNIRLDRTAAQEELLRIEGHYSTRRKHGRDYWLVVDHWPDARIDRELKVPYSLYSSAMTGQCLRVSWHRGHHHDPWISSMQPAASCDKSG